MNNVVLQLTTFRTFLQPYIVHHFV